MAKSAKSLVLFRIDGLTGEKSAVQSKDHVPRGSQQRDTQPAFTKLELTEKKIAGSYLEAEITHREGVAINGYWHDQPILEVVSVAVFPAYYNRSRKVFVVEAPHSLASAAIRRLNKDCPDDVHLSPVHLDFNAMLGDTDDIEVLGAWALSPKAAIRSRAAFSGADLQKHDDFKKMRKAGVLSNLSLRYPFDEETLRVSVSLSCAAFFLGPVAIKRQLKFMEHLAGFEAKQRP